MGSAARQSLAVAAFAACALLWASAAPAAPPAIESQARLDGTVRFLQEVQNPDGGFGGARGAASDPDFSAWVALALAAAGINPQDQATPGGLSVYTYLTGHARELNATTDYARALLVADAAGTSPYDFGRIDLSSAILGRQLPNGAFAHALGGQPGVNDTVFAILALSPVKNQIIAGTLARAARWL